MLGRLTVFATLACAALAYAPPLLHVEPLEVLPVAPRWVARKVPRPADEDTSPATQEARARVRDRRPHAPPMAVAATSYGQPRPTPVHFVCGPWEPLGRVADHAAPVPSLPRTSTAGHVQRCEVTAI